MGKMPNLLLTCVLSLVCGFLGALGAVTAFHDQLRGPQGVTGLAGPAGEQGVPGDDGVDGLDGLDGERGPRGRPGRAARKGPRDLGTGNCAGRSVEVVTDVAIQGRELQTEKKPICVSE